MEPLSVIGVCRSQKNLFWFQNVFLAIFSFIPDFLFIKLLKLIDKFYRNERACVSKRNIDSFFRVALLVKIQRNNQRRIDLWT